MGSIVTADRIAINGSGFHSRQPEYPRICSANTFIVIKHLICRIVCIQVEFKEVNFWITWQVWRLELSALL
jgi:hypothetical protein